MNRGIGGFGAGVKRSEPIAWAAGGIYRLTHGFGVMPSQVRVVLRFTAASGRFAAGDEMEAVFRGDAGDLREFGGHDVVHAVGGIRAVQHDLDDRATLLEAQRLVFAHAAHVNR